MKRGTSLTNSEDTIEIQRDNKNQNGLDHTYDDKTIGTANPDPIKVAIIGGGLMGMVLAHRISKESASVQVFERDSQMGGLSTYHDYGNFTWDKFYHVIVPSDSNLIRLIDEIGLSDQLNWTRALSGYYAKKEFYSLNGAKDYLLFPLLNIWDKFRLAFTIFYGSRISNWKKLEKYTVKEWLVRMGGPTNFERFWAPLLLAKLGDNYKKVSGVFIWTYIRRMFKKREFPIKRDHMGYVSGGYKTVFDKLAERINKNTNSFIHLNTTVRSIVPAEGGGILVEYADKIEHFDKVVFTAPLNILEQVTAPEICEITNGNGTIDYMGVVCLVLTTKKPLTPFYILNIGDVDTPFTGVIGMSTLVAEGQTAGEYLTYFPKYIPKEHPYWKISDSELKALFLKGVHDLYPKFDETDIVSAHMNRAAKVQPLQVVNYSEIIPKIHTKHEDFFVLNTSQFVNDSVNNNSVVSHVNSFIQKFKNEFQAVKQR